MLHQSYVFKSIHTQISHGSHFHTQPLINIIISEYYVLNDINNDLNNMENGFENNEIKMNNCRNISNVQRRNSILVNQDLFYMKKKSITQNKLNGKRIAWTKCLIIGLIFIILIITFHFSIAKILKHKLYVNENDELNNNIDNINWNYLFKFENNIIFEYNPFYSTIGIIFMCFTVYEIYFIINILFRFKFGLINFCYLLFCFCCKHNWYVEKNMFFATTHWFIIMV